MIYPLTTLPERTNSYELNKETEKQRGKKLRVKRNGNKQNKLNH